MLPLSLGTFPLCCMTLVQVPLCTWANCLLISLQAINVGRKKNQKLPFPFLIFGLLESQKPLQEPNEYLSATLQPYIFRYKENDVGNEGEQETGVATDQPLVAIDQQLGAGPSSSSTFQSFFKAKLPSRRSRCSMIKSLTRPLYNCSNWKSSYTMPLSCSSEALPLVKMFQQDLLLQQCHQRNHQKPLLQQHPSQLLRHQRKKKAIISFISFIFYVFSFRFYLLEQCLFSLFIFFFSFQSLYQKRGEIFSFSGKIFAYFYNYCVCLFLEFSLFQVHMCFAKKDTKRGDC